MARLARVVVVDVPHHVTRRGNARQCVLNTDADRAVYLNLLGQYVKLYGLSLWGYCLMSNHVHLITVPHRADALALMMKQAQGRFSSYWNAKRGLSGHAWQGALLLLRDVSRALVGGATVRRAESGAGEHGGKGGGVALVERRGALWHGGASGLSGNGGLAAAVGHGAVAAVPLGRGQRGGRCDPGFAELQCCSVRA
jgi:REP element-mobilizing transposase RayT